MLPHRLQPCCCKLSCRWRESAISGFNHDSFMQTTQLWTWINARGTGYKFDIFVNRQRMLILIHDGIDILAKEAHLGAACSSIRMLLLSIRCSLTYNSTWSQSSTKANRVSKQHWFRTIVLADEDRNAAKNPARKDYVDAELERSHSKSACINVPSEATVLETAELLQRNHLPYIHFVHCTLNEASVILLAISSCQRRFIPLLFSRTL